jgi:hypothetical protein
MEVISPPLYFTEEGVKQVQAVCGILTNQYRIHINETCGVHVHVGFEDAGYSPEVLRNLMATIWTFEKWIEQIHPPDRRGVKNQYCQGMEGSALFEHLSSEEYLQNDSNSSGTTLYNGLKILFAAEPKLSHLLPCFTNNGMARTAYSLKCLDLEGDYGSKRTVEFRQHEGTMDGERVASWVKVCVGLVKFADTVETDLLRWFCRAHIEDRVENFNVENFLYAVGLPTQALYYGRMIRARKLDEEKRSLQKAELQDF